MSYNRLYSTNHCIVKVYGNGINRKIKVVRMKTCRVIGAEIEGEDKNKKSRAEITETEKRANNISRARQKIFELAYCNPWDWFCTFTLDPSKYDRSNLDKFHKDFTKWIANYNRLHNTSIKFLLVPEPHANHDAWHMHGFLYGLPVEHLHQFVIGDKMGKALADKVKKGDLVYNWLAYMRKFGFCDLEPVRNPEAAAKYVTKYISKGLGEGVAVNAHLYYHSRGLQTADIACSGYLDMDFGVPDYIGDYCSVYWLPYSEKLLSNLKEKCLSDDIVFAPDMGLKSMAVNEPVLENKEFEVDRLLSDVNLDLILSSRKDRQPLIELSNWIDFECDDLPF